MTETLRCKQIKPVFSPEKIAVRVRELAEEIDALYGDEPLVAVCVLKGGFIFCSDLVRFLHNKNLEVDFVRLSSYGRGCRSSGKIVFSKDAETDLCDKHVLMVEDVVDSGRSMRFLLDVFAARRVRSLRLAALVDKQERREVEVHVDFAAFQLNSGFIVGYGLDYAEHWRALPGVCEIIVEQPEK
ncbi:MAG: hypoxanthine phosphoribosyltransferase [Desulfovibrio sp.]|jgi:hypoxanthine phosphoribosyltransferase|nr:hypoxanthine phosphoribosyltransferase [Desulfovibrio sp.]